MTGPTSSAADASTPAGTDASTCDYCGEPVAGRYCEECGYDTSGLTALPAEVDSAPPPGSGPTLSLEVVADRLWYERVRANQGPDVDTVIFPDLVLPRTFRLQGDQLTVGRRSVSRGVFPDIDLTGPPLDPGVSALHLLLLPERDGTWSLLDPGSTNGVFLDEEREMVSPNTRRPIAVGTVIHLGAWTSMTVVEEAT